MKVNVKKLWSNAKLPVYGSEGAACFDLHALRDEIIPSNEICIISTGLLFEVPEGHVMLLFGRSGHAAKGLQLANCVGVIDSDYRGEVKVMLRNDTDFSKYVEEGERCAQAMIIPTLGISFNEIGSPSDTKRGKGGFGSTGNKIPLLIV